MTSKTLRLSIIAITLTLISMAIYAFALNTSLPWHPLQQIVRDPTSPTPTSLDENNNGRIDPGIIEDTLQEITNNGASTTNPITVGGLTSNGGIVVSGNAVFNGNVRLPSIICGTGKRLHTDVNGNIVCGNNDDDPTNELQTLTKSSNQICLSNSGGCVVDDVNDADANPTNELQTLAQVLQRGNNAGGRSITGVGSLSVNQLCLSDGCKTAWSQVGGTRPQIIVKRIGYCWECSTNIYNVDVCFLSRYYFWDSKGHNGWEACEVWKEGNYWKLHFRTTDTEQGYCEAICLKW